jgi:hypothetical protein
LRELELFWLRCVHGSAEESTCPRILTVKTRVNVPLL